MSKTNQILIQVANTVVTYDHIIEFLHVVKNNLHMSVLNQAMIYFQNPDAKMVCGKEAWKKMGRTIKEHAVPIVLFFPSIKMTKPPKQYEENGVAQVVEGTSVPIYMENVIYSNDYIPVNAFDLESTEGADIPDHNFNYETVMDNILHITQATCEYADIQSVSLVKGKYDKDKNIFYFSNNLFDLDKKGQEQETKKAALYMYLDYIFETYHIKDKLLKQAIIYVLFDYYNFPGQTISQAAFKRLDQKSEEEKISFLSLLQFYTSNIVQDFDGYYLDFDETALSNNLLYTRDMKKVFHLFDSVIRSIEDDILRNEIANLKTKLLRAGGDYLQRLYQLCKSKQLYSYPPHEIMLDNTDYLLEDREKLLRTAEQIVEGSVHMSTYSSSKTYP